MAAADNIETQRISEFVTQLVRITQIDGAVVYGVDRNGNSVKIEVSQLRTDLTDVETRLGNVETKAENNRSNISTLQTTVQGKANTVHTHAINDITDLSTELAAKATAADVAELNQQIASVESALDGKSDVGHTHTISNVAGLQNALDGKANTVHTHTIANITNLSDTISGINNNISSVNDDVTALAARVSDLENIGISDVNGLQAALDGKAERVHVHQISDIADLQTELDTKAGQAAIDAVDEEILTLSGSVNGLSNQVVDLREAIDHIQIDGGLKQVETFEGLTTTDGMIVEYVGETTQQYKNGRFYQYSETNDEWTQVVTDEPVSVAYDSETEQLTFYNIETIQS